MSQRETGRRTLDHMFGAGYADKLGENRNALTDPLYDFIEEHNFGGTWSREGLDIRRRCELTVAMLVALGKPQAQPYMEAALDAGTTVDELREILRHAALYAGLPAAVEGFRMAEEVLRARGLLD